MKNEYDHNNVFAKIISGELDCVKVAENDHAIAFEDINKVADVHIIVIPRAAYSNYHNMLDEADGQTVHMTMALLRDVIKKLKLEDKGYRIVCNCGAVGMQTVQHVHFHLISDHAPLGSMTSNSKTEWAG